MRINTFVKKLAVAFIEDSEEETVAFLKGWVIGRLKKVTVVDLAKAVQQNVDLWDMAPGREKRVALELAKRHRKLFNKYRHAITVENLLRWMSEDRPDLASYIINDGSGKAEAWLYGMVDKVKMRLWEQGALEQDLPKRS